MKQADIITGETYFNKRTRQPFTVKRRQKRKKNYPQQLGNIKKGAAPTRYYDVDGNKANACELEPIDIKESI